MTSLAFRRLAGAAMLLLFVAAEWQSLGAHPTLPRAAADLGLVALIVVSWAGNLRWPHGAWAIALGAASVTLAAVGGGPIATVGVVTALIQLGVRYPPRIGIPIGVVIVAGYLATPAGRAARSPVDLALTVFGLGAAYGIALSFRLLRDERARLADAVEELRRSRAAQVDAAKVEERARLAREIHDVLAHTLSALAVQLEGARLLLRERPGDPAAGEAVARAQRLARDGLEEARRAVGTLRGDALPGPDALARLAGDFERDTGVPCRFAVEGEPVELSSEARLALYRTAQEALTNVRRHAAAEAVDVALRWSPAGAELVVEDQGIPRGDPAANGYGLVGMRERAELIGGELEAGPRPGGFRVRLRVPAR